MQLQFKGCYIEPILRGSKTQTLRAVLGAGARIGADLTFANGYRPHSLFARSTLVAIDQVAVMDLSESDAVAGGLESRDAMLSALAKLYPTAQSLWRLRWDPIIRVRSFASPLSRR